MQNDPNIRELPPRMVRGLLESLEQRTALEYIEIFFKYLVKSSGYLNQEDYKKALELLPEGGEKIMETLADQWLRQGKHEGVILGKQEGLVEGKLEATRETLIDLAAEIYGPLPGMLPVKIKSIQSIDNLRALTRKIVRTSSLEEFSEMVNKATEE